MDNINKIQLLQKYIVLHNSHNNLLNQIIKSNINLINIQIFDIIKISKNIYKQDICQIKIVIEPYIIDSLVHNIKDIIINIKLKKIDINKQNIISLFNNNVKGIEINLTEFNINHCGKEGYWLETKMGIKHNYKNEPDIYGYEMKKSSIKTTLGDFSASEYAFSKINNRNIINYHNNWTDNIKINRTDFIRYFGNSNPNKNNRYSWSGKCIPKYNIWNSNGQNLLILYNNDIVIYYLFSKDTRSIKHTFPEFLKTKNNIMIAIWKVEKIKPHINNKFNQNGFFICKKINNKYEYICFGKPFNYEYFIECIKNKKIIFDSGMYEGNLRNYSHFRGINFWNELITEEY